MKTANLVLNLKMKKMSGMTEVSTQYVLECPQSAKRKKQSKLTCNETMPSQTYIPIGKARFLKDLSDIDGSICLVHMVWCCLFVCTYSILSGVIFDGLWET